METESPKRETPAPAPAGNSIKHSRLCCVPGQNHRTAFPQSASASSTLYPRASGAGRRGSFGYFCIPPGQRQRILGSRFVQLAVLGNSLGTSAGTCIPLELW